MKIIEQLNGKSYEEGEQILLSNGYKYTNGYSENIKEDICVEDNYFTKVDKDNDSIDRITFARYWRGSLFNMNPKYIEEKWEQALISR